MFLEWKFQDPKMEVLYHMRPYFMGIFPYIGLIHGRYLQFRFLKWPMISDPVMIIIIFIQPSIWLIIRQMATNIKCPFNIICPNAWNSFPESYPSTPQRMGLSLRGIVSSPCFSAFQVSHPCFMVKFANPCFSLGCTNQQKPLEVQRKTQNGYVWKWGIPPIIAI